MHSTTSTHSFPLEQKLWGKLRQSTPHEEQYLCRSGPSCCIWSTHFCTGREQPHQSRCILKFPCHIQGPSVCTSCQLLGRGGQHQHGSLWTHHHAHSLSLGIPFSWCAALIYFFFFFFFFSNICSIRRESRLPYVTTSCVSTIICTGK